MPTRAPLSRSHCSIPANTRKPYRSSRSCAATTRITRSPWNTWPASTSGWAPPHAAVAAYTQLADLQQERRLGIRAIEALREVLRLRPDADDQRLRMARLIEESGSPSEATAEYIELARRCQSQSRIEEATTYAERALRIDPSSREAKELIATLHETLSNAAQIAVTSPAPAGESASAFYPSRGAHTGALRSQQFAIEQIIALAQKHQEAGDAEAAIEQYERAVKLGMERSDVFYSLGLLYQERGDHQRAAEALTRAASDPEYALSAHYALGTSLPGAGPAATGRSGVRADHPASRSPVDRQGRIR